MNLSAKSIAARMGGRVEGDSALVPGPGHQAADKVDAFHRNIVDGLRQVAHGVGLVRTLGASTVEGIIGAAFAGSVEVGS